MTAVVHDGLLSVDCQLVPKQHSCEPVQGWRTHDLFVILTLNGWDSAIFLRYASNCQERSSLEIVSWEPVGSNNSMTRPIFEVQRSCNGHSIILDSLRHSIAIGSDTSPASKLMQTREFELYRTKIVLKDWSICLVKNGICWTNEAVLHPTGSISEASDRVETIFIPGNFCAVDDYAASSSN
ncbi:hypothetical protein BOTCAL_0208g00180 [Botryotinia calthae]|uniref:Uncharacterized protein n=1 Tax=Botryotinia calthae TaxID=38488 RepID=A0A4Y8CYX3_9HELO|nr:hypothetical protein BOTCAL_0208g00180 [Botryotinia calthae]